MGGGGTLPATHRRPQPVVVTAEDHAKKVESIMATQRRRVSPLRGMVGAWLVVTGAAALLVSSNLRTDGSMTLVGVNAPVNQGARSTLDITAHNSPSIVRNPVDESNLAIVNRIDTPVFSCGLHVSTDGGSTWAGSSIPIPTGEEPKCFAPDAAFGADGTFYLFFVTLQGLGNTPNAGWISTSGDGGRTIGTPVRALGPLAFQARLVADPKDAGRLYLSWLQASATGNLMFPEPGYPIQVARSENGGATWSAPVRVSPATRERAVAPSPVVGAGGEFYLAYLDLGDDRLDYEGGHEGRGGEPYGGSWELVVARSTDGGRSWRETVAEKRLVPTDRFVVFLPPFPSVAVGKNGKVHVAFHDGRDGDSDVWLWRSDDQAASFSPPVRVNDTTRRDGTSQYLPKLTASPNGRLDVLYYDRRGDEKNVMNESSLQSSFDGGRTFTPRLRLSSRAFSSRIGFGNERGMPDLGGRLGLVSTEKRAMAVWTDTRAGTEASNKQDVVRAVVQALDPSGLSVEELRLVRISGVAVVTLGGGLLGSWLASRRRPPEVTA